MIEQKDQEKIKEMYFHAMYSIQQIEKQMRKKYTYAEIKNFLYNYIEKVGK